LDVRVRLFATLREGRQKELKAEINEKTTVKDIINMLKIRSEEVAILLVNGRDGRLDGALADGDVISIFPPVGGG